jgi:hypothetical protein
MDFMFTEFNSEFMKPMYFSYLGYDLCCDFQLTALTEEYKNIFAFIFFYFFFLKKKKTKK